MIEELIAEIELEAKGSRKVLERIPESEFGWKPHEKSFSMGELASHLATILTWGSTAVTTEVFDMDPEQWKPWVAKSNLELVEKFDANLKALIEGLHKLAPEKMAETWTMKVKGETVISMPRTAVMRNFVVNHIIHHRGQLTVYLRMRDIPVPALYGPSADEK